MINNGADLFFRTANYLSASLLYLRENILLSRPLVPDDFKTKITGHWGCSPGINAIYTSLLSVSVERNLHYDLVIGTGHAGHAMLSCLFLSGDITRNYPDITMDEIGLCELSRRIGEPYGFRNELDISYPGVIFPTAELGNALGYAQGLSIGQPSRNVACIIGDGEMEAATTQSAWTGIWAANKELEHPPLPIVNMNGWRMGSKAFFSSLDNDELRAYFGGMGYKCDIIQNDLQELIFAIDHAQSKLSQGVKFGNYPVVVFRSPKGMGAPLTMGGELFAGQSASHKPRLRAPAFVAEERAEIYEWLRSYQPWTLFDQSGAPLSSLAGASLLKKGECIEADHVEKEAEVILGNPMASLANALCTWDSRVVVVSPDELVSNGLSKLFTQPSDGEGSSEEVTIIEFLNEDICFSWALGITRSGRNCILVSYEAFAQRFESQLIQAIRFYSESWEGDQYRSVIIILTSLGWYNVASHHNPGLVDGVVERDFSNLKVFFPYFARDLIDLVRKALRKNNLFYIFVVSKTKFPFLSHLESRAIKERYVMDEKRLLPLRCPASENILLICIGDCVAEEALAAGDILFRDYGVECGIYGLYVLPGPNDVLTRTLFEICNGKAPILWIYQGLKRTIRSVLERCSLRADAILGFEDHVTSSPGQARLEENHVGRCEITLEALRLTQHSFNNPL